MLPSIPSLSSGSSRCLSMVMGLAKMPLAGSLGVKTQVKN